MAEAECLKGFGLDPDSKSAFKPPSLHSALIPEILGNVFSRMNTGTLRSAALVCLSWSELSLNVLWEDMDSVLPLLKILAPMTCNTDNIWDFDAGLSQPKWDRFDAYARRVHVLKHSDIGHEGMEKIDPDLLMHLLACLPFNHGPLLPNLKELKWTGWCDDIFFPQVLVFLSPSLRTLHITTENNLDAGVLMCRTIQGLAGRHDMKLTGLNLKVYGDDHPSLPSAMASLLNAQQSLRSIKICSFPTPGPIALALLNLADLREVEFEIEVSNPTELGEFLASLVESCSLMETLELGVEVDPDLWPIGENLAFAHFAPILRASRLSALRIIYWPAFPLQERDVMAMGNAWPRLKSLDTSSSIPISNLSTYASAFSSIQSLNIHLTFPQRPLFDQSTPCFPSLRIIRLSGQPPEDQIPAVAAFLSWVCPPTTEISSGYQTMPWRKHWDVIKETIKVGHQLQAATASRLGVINTSSISEPMVID